MTQKREQSLKAPICPYCGDAHSEPWRVFDNPVGVDYYNVVVECENCHKEYLASRITVFSYCTQSIDI